MKDKLQND